MRRLPPLNALRAFEAAARHLSFTRAAAELHVTQAAISQEVCAAFDRLAAATERLQRQDASGIVNASVLPSFLAKWLLPRLGRFREAHPEIDLRLSSSQELVDFARDNFDVGIRAGHGRYPGLRVDLIMRDTIIPVCSPALLEGPRPLREPADLRYHTLLHDEPRDLWQLWFKLVGITDIDPWRGPGFTDSGMLIQAAIEGQGVALAHATLAARDLAEGRLVRPFSQGLPNEYAYWLVCPEATADRPKIVAFREWLLAEAARDRRGAAPAPAPK
jgi:LysR family glycine cleavage system transcriptional activator